MVVRKDTIAKSTVLIYCGMQMLSFLGSIYSGWVLDKTGSANRGFYTAIMILILNVVLMNMFSFEYKARQKRLAWVSNLAENEERKVR